MAVETPGNMLITVLDWLHLDLPLMGFTDALRRRRGIYPANEFRLIPGVEAALLALGSPLSVGPYHHPQSLSYRAIFAAFPHHCPRF